MKKSFLLFPLLIAGITFSTFAKDKATPKNPESVTYADIIKANSKKSLLKRHKNWKQTTIAAESGALQVQALDYYSRVSYSTSDMMYAEFDYTSLDTPVKSTKELYTKQDSCWTLFFKDEGSKSIVQWPVMTDKERKSLASNIDTGSILDGSDLGEVFESIRANEDGSLTMTTTAPAATSTDVRFLPEEWKDARIEYAYTVDADSLELSKLETFIITKNASIKYFTESLDYDVEIPEYHKELKELLKKAASNKIENPRTITVVYNPDTKDEERFVRSADISYGVLPLYRDGYKPFKDKEGKEAFSGSDGKSDITIYAIKD